MDYHGCSSSSSLLLQHLGFVDDEIHKGELELPDDASFDVPMNERGFISSCDRPSVDSLEGQPRQRRQSSDHLRESDVQEDPERPFHVPPWKGTFTFCVNKRGNERVDSTSKGRSYGPFGDDGSAGEVDDGLETETYERHLVRIVTELDDLEKEDETVEYRDATPALTMASSMTPLSETSPPTPADDLPVTTSSEKDPTATCNLQRKRRKVTSEQGAITVKPVTRSSPSDQNTPKWKRAATASDRERTNQGRKASSRKKTKKRDEMFNVNFLLERFGFVSVYDDNQAWPCPFPRAASIGATCQNCFDASGLYEHVNKHIAAFEEHHRGQALECPFKAKMGCEWGSESRKEVTKIGPNDTLARHVVDSHHKARRVQCPCGGIVGRGTLDQVVRHLEGPGHTAKLQKKKRDDTDFPNYPNIINDRIRLLQEQRLWEQVANARTDCDRQEESSNGRKRARHEL